MDGDDELLYSIGRGLGQCISAIVILYFVKKGVAHCCCRRGQPAAAEARPEVSQVTVDGVATSVDHLIHKKDLYTTYVLCACGGVFGAHHFYLDRVTHGVICIWTANFFFFGYLFDLVAVPYYVRNHNHKAVDAKAYGATPPKKKFMCCGFLSWRVFLAYLTLFVFFIVALIKLPRFLHDANVLDIDAAIAGTKANPYEILGVPRGSSENIAAEAYLKRVGALEFSGKKCDAKCEMKVEQLEKAADFIDGGWKLSHGGYKDDMSAWDDWADFVALEWEVVLAHIQIALKDPNTFRADAPRQQPRSRAMGKAKGAKAPGPAMGKASSKSSSKTGAAGRGPTADL